MTTDPTTTDHDNDATEHQPVMNTDRELFRESTGEKPSDYYENSVHVTTAGHIGMNVGGRVVVLPIAKWHELAWPLTPSQRTGRDHDHARDCVR